MTTVGKWACSPFYVEFSVADIVLGYVLIFGERIVMLKSAPALKEYVKRCKAQFSFAKVIIYGKKGRLKTDHACDYKMCALQLNFEMT